MLDKVGQRIEPGVWIAYGHVSNSAGMLRLGFVLEVREGVHKTATPWLRDDRIVVWGISDDHAAYAAHNPGVKWAEPQPLSRQSTLQFPDRVIVIDAAVVPAAYQKMIEDLGIKV